MQDINREVKEVLRKAKVSFIPVGHGIKKWYKSNTIKCRKCNGLGKIAVTHSGTHNISFSVKLRPCPKCNGTGEIKV